MNKFLKILVSSVLAASVMVSFAACSNNDPSTDEPTDPDEAFGITKLPENDFENDPNRHDRKPVQKTLTLKGGATFADGTTSKVFDSGTELVLGEDIKLTVPEGRIVTGWLADNTENADLYGEFYAGTNFETLRKDASIQPVFDVPSESYASQTVSEGEEPTFGKVSGFAWEQRTDAPQTADNAYICADNLTNITVNNELGSYFHVMGGTAEAADSEQSVPEGWHTLFLSKYQVVKTQAYGVTYTVQNFGDEAIDIRVYQTNSSGSYMPSDKGSAPVHLEPNEVGQMFVSFSGWENGNILTSVELLNTVEELKIGMYAYVSDWTEPESHKLSVTDSKITTAGDAASADIDAGELVELEYTGTLGADEIFCGWQDVADKADKYPSSFVMPNKELSLEPWIENKADHMHTVTLVGEDISFADGTMTAEYGWNDELNLSDIKYTGDLKPGHKVIYSVVGGGIKSELTSGDVYTMPDGDVTITFLRTEVVWSSSNGKVAMAPFAEDVVDSNPHGIRRDKSQMAPTGGDLSALRTKFDSSSVDISASIGEIDGEQAAIYDLRGYTQGSGTEDDPERFLDTIATDAVFMQQVNHSVVAGKYTDTATIKNLGTEEITIQIHISRSSGNYSQNGSSKVITIKPGETVTVEYEVNFDKENGSEMISIQYKGAQPIASMKLAMYIYRQPQG